MMKSHSQTVLAWLIGGFVLALGQQTSAAERSRLIIETDAGGDPDDEQSLVRFLLYANEWDIEGIIANRPKAREGENRNPERTGLGIVRRLLNAYGECYPNLIKHDTRYPTSDYMWQRTVAGYNDTDDAVKLLIGAVDKEDSRPVWYSDWGTDHGAATNNLRRALDKVLRERGPRGYAKFKSRLRLSSTDAFGDHTAKIDPPFPLWVDTFRPELDGKRWYHRFSTLTARASGFDLVRDCLAGHDQLGALYPTNTTHWQKEGDTMTFLYLVPTGMNDLGQLGGSLRVERQFYRQALLLGEPGGRVEWENESRQHAGALGRTLAKRFQSAAGLVRKGFRAGQPSACAPSPWRIEANGEGP
jgi:hypothetical protein